MTKDLKLPGLRGDPQMAEGYAGWRVEQDNLRGYLSPTKEEAVREWNRMVRRIIRECRKGKE